MQSMRQYRFQGTALALFLTLTALICVLLALQVQKRKKNSTAQHTAAATTTMAAAASGVTHGAVVSLSSAAWTAFPNAHASAACGIVSVDGLGWLDGDYTLADTSRWSGGKPAWILLRPESPYTVLLAWSGLESVWAMSFGEENANLRYAAFLPAGSYPATGQVPPAHSSRWQIFENKSSRFEENKNMVTISCPACAAATISGLQDDMSTCNGPYRARRVYREPVDISVWSHVVDHQCTLLHDKAGKVLVTQDNSAGVEDAIIGLKEAWGRQYDEVETHPPHGDEYAGIDWWTRLLEESHTWPKQDGVVVECISAGKTSRLTFTMSCNLPAAKRDSADKNRSTSQAPDGDIPTRATQYVFSAPQDGSLISIAQGQVHLRVSVGDDTSVKQGATFNEVVSNGKDIPDDVLNSQDVRVISNRETYVTMPLRTLIMDGALVQLPDGVEGTHVIEVWLLGTGRSSGVPHLTGGQPAEEWPYLAHGIVTFEAFPRETYMLQRRYSNEGITSATTMGSSLEPAPPPSETRVVFISNLRDVDGYKLSTVHLARHLPDHIRASVLDVSCEDGELVMQEVYEKEVDQVIRLCITPEDETWEKARQENQGFPTLLYTIFSAAEQWSDITETRPDIARAFTKVYSHLGGFDTVVISNGGKDIDGYLLHLARLAGVRNRVVNLGSIAGGYLSARFDAATAFVGPSHYVAHNPATNRHARGLPIKICHPVMDAARILRAARSCPTPPSGSDDGIEGTTNRRTSASNSSDWDGTSTVSSRDTEASRSRQDGSLSAAGDGFTVTDNAFSDQVGTLEGERSDNQGGRFVMVSRVSQEKTPGVFVRAMGALQRRQQLRQGARQARAEGVYVGTGRLLEPMKQLARDIGADIRFAGLLGVDIVPCEVAQATALVLPSFAAETFGMVAPEAMILGVPVVTFGYGGTGELVRHMENGIIVSEPTPRALADALELLVRDSALRDRLGAQARVDALRALSLPELVACHVDEFV